VASKSLMEWLKMLWDNRRTSASCVALFCLVLCPDLSVRPSPAAGEFIFLL
jgi:hypothetical protein